MLLCWAFFSWVSWHPWFLTLAKKGDPQFDKFHCRVDVIVENCQIRFSKKLTIFFIIIWPFEIYFKYHITLIVILSGIMLSVLLLSVTAPFHLWLSQGKEIHDLINAFFDESISLLKTARSASRKKLAFSFTVWLFKPLSLWLFLEIYPKRFFWKQ
jgi:hypothetical protein